MGGALSDYNLRQSNLRVENADVSSSNPVPTSGGLIVTNAIDQTAFDVNAAPFSATTSISNDYKLSNILLNFSTTESKTITVTGPDGTILRGGTVDTSAKNVLRNTTGQHFDLSFGEKAFDANDNITVTVTQTAGACLMDCVAKVIEGSGGLTGNPVLGAGTNLIGSVRREPETVGNPKTFEDTNFVTGDSPATLDVNTALGRDATQFNIINDGAGNFTVALSNDGASFGDEHTMKNGEVYSLENYSLDTIRITWVADSAYRVVVI